MRSGDVHSDHSEQKSCGPGGTEPSKGASPPVSSNDVERIDRRHYNDLWLDAAQKHETFKVCS